MTSAWSIVWSGLEINALADVAARRSIIVTRGIVPVDRLLIEETVCSTSAGLVARYDNPENEKREAIAEACRSSNIFPAMRARRTGRRSLSPSETE
jgi:hypothetical protein